MCGLSLKLFKGMVLRMGTFAPWGPLGNIWRHFGLWQPKCHWACELLLSSDGQKPGSLHNFPLFAGQDGPYQEVFSQPQKSAVHSAETLLYTQAKGK